jgi:hypothetical protein
MNPVTATLCAAVAVWCFGTAAYAEDTGYSTTSRLSPKVDQDINQAAGILVDKSPADIDSEIKDLDATRAALDKQKTPALSLSVSGWVTQETQFNVK